MHCAAPRIDRKNLCCTFRTLRRLLDLGALSFLCYLIVLFCWYKFHGKILKLAQSEHVFIVTSMAEVLKRFSTHIKIKKSIKFVDALQRYANVHMHNALLTYSWPLLRNQLHTHRPPKLSTMNNAKLVFADFVNQRVMHRFYVTVIVKMNLLKWKRKGEKIEELFTKIRTTLKIVDKSSDNGNEFFLNKISEEKPTNGEVFRPSILFMMWIKRLVLFLSQIFSSFFKCFQLFFFDNRFQFDKTFETIEFKIHANFVCVENPSVIRWPLDQCVGNEHCLFVSHIIEYSKIIEEESDMTQSVVAHILTYSKQKK